MATPEWASNRIEQEVEAWLARLNPDGDEALAQVVRQLRAWPVYADIGGTLLIDKRGEV